MAFIDKKGEAPIHAQSPGMIFRHPLETRPLSLKQSENKLVASVLNFCISPVVAKCAIDTQRGFIHERILTQNPIDLDYAGRLHAFEYFADRTSLKLIHIASMGMVAAIPILVLFDFAAAFPSVAHAWIFTVLRGIKLWGGYISGIKGLYTSNKAYGYSGGFVVFLFWIVAGVLQGCPMSGTLFVFAIDPLLWSFKVKISSAVVRTCADDIGMALKRLDMLALLYKLFHDFKSASNLTLKPPKTIIIHTVTKNSNWNNDWIKRWLRRFIPQWQYMIIKDSSKYLGFHLGPRAGANQWTEAISKFAERVIDLRNLDLPLRLAVNRYNYKILPVLGYIGQLALPPLVCVGLSSPLSSKL